MELTRRGFLTAMGALAAGTALVPPIGGRPPAGPESPHEHARGLARRLRDGAAPRAILAESRASLGDVESRLAAATGWTRTRLQRAAALTALVAASAAYLGGLPGTRALLDRADRHARDANDGPLLAQSLLWRARHVGDRGYAIDAGTSRGRDLLAAALARAGSDRPLRAVIGYGLAWEHAALGETRAALRRLLAADADHALVTAAPDVIEVDPATLPLLPSAGQAAVLRRLGEDGEAIAAGAPARGGGPVWWRTMRMVDMARSQAASGDVPAAAATLEAAYRLNAAAGLAQRQRRIRTARALFPDTAAVRHLDAVMRG